MDIAKSLLKETNNLYFIMKVTGLTKEQIDDLK